MSSKEAQALQCETFIAVRLSEFASQIRRIWVGATGQVQNRVVLTAELTEKRVRGDDTPGETTRNWFFYQF